VRQQPVDFNVNDSFADLEALVRRLLSGATVLAEDTTVDLSRCHYLGPTGVVALTLLRRDAARRGITLQIVPPEIPQLHAYCGYSGLLREFGIGEPPQPHPDNASTPVCSFALLPQAEIEQVLRIAEREIPFSQTARQHLTLALSEVAQNVLDHAMSGLGGIMSARAFKGQREVRFAVADGGVGFFHTLSRRMNVADEGHAIRRALEEGVTSRSSSHNMGWGLSHLQAIVKRTGGQMMIYSRTGAGTSGPTNDRFLARRVEFPGTIVFVRLPAVAAEWDDSDHDGDVWG